ncbi:uncharacterized protein ACA1_031810 [Acanthamoeba castellanii str. Neff]|uniref:Uncharacterized protein n=1 Tax=Acanthamoeba castellanii (strain ATCC 30010 / Neff) TaxID=1257118 RepID=L8H1S7_ACACF|nr:uncharacterized protein ACA1_031810 [Acanthamoeba castellanii str. Neff]ELR19157.1 hypothetical protein ACA1_031810 [Acanthamoeba castellanii str. Neff]
MTTSSSTLLRFFSFALLSFSTNKTGFSRAVAGGDIVFNVTIDAPALTLPNMQLTAHNFDVDLSVSRLHVPMVNYAAYGGLLLVQLFMFVVLILAHLCVVRRLRAILAKHHLEDDDEGLDDKAGAGDYVILEKDGVRYDADGGDRRRAGGFGRHEQSCEGCGRGCAADAHFCACCGRPLSLQRPAPTTTHSHN